MKKYILIKNHKKILTNMAHIVFRSLLPLCICFFFSCSHKPFIYKNENSFVRFNKYLFEDKSKEVNNSCFININYPQIYNLKNLEKQSEINEHLKKEFLRDKNNYCDESLQEEIITRVEIKYTYYLSDNLLSILSSETFSSDIAAGQVVKSFNIDLKTGKFLRLKDLFIVEYKEEITQIVIDKVFSVYDKDKNAESLYKYYSSIKEDVFNRFQVQVLRDSIVFRFRGDSEVEPIYYAEIPIKRIKDFINKKYI